MGVAFNSTIVSSKISRVTIGIIWHRGKQVSENMPRQSRLFVIGTSGHSVVFVIISRGKIWPCVLRGGISLAYFGKCQFHKRFQNQKYKTLNKVNKNGLVTQKSYTNKLLYRHPT